MKAISLMEPAANTCASLLTMHLVGSCSASSVHLCTGSLQRIINQIV